MVAVEFVSSPTKVSLIGGTGIPGKKEDFEKSIAAICIASKAPKSNYKRIFNSLSESQVRKVIDYIVEDDLHQLKHPHLTWNIACTRIATFDEVHDKKSYTQKSQRYSVNWPISHIPEKKQELEFIQITEPALSVFKDAVQSAFKYYHKMVAKKVLPEDARDVLPLSSMNSIMSTRNLYDELEKIASSIYGDKTGEIQKIGEKKYEILHELAPNICDEDKKILDKFNPHRNCTSVYNTNKELENIISDLNLDPKPTDVQQTFIIEPKDPGFNLGIAALTTVTTPDAEELIEKLKNKETINIRDPLTGKVRTFKLTRDMLDSVLRNVVTSGHFSVLEHDIRTAEFKNLTKAINHQLIRTRHTWDNYTDLLEAGKYFSYRLASEVASKGFTDEFNSQMHKMKEAFDVLYDNGTPEAIYILPNAIHMDAYFTTNSAQWHHFIYARTCFKAQKPIRINVAMPVWKYLTETDRTTFKTSGPDCLQLDYRGLADRDRKKYPCKEFNPCGTPYRRNPYLKKGETDTIK